MSKEAQTQTSHSIDYREPLKHILCTALIYIRTLSVELKKLDLQERIEDNSKEKLQTATYLHNVMVTVSDIIHPAHDFLSDIFPGDQKFYEELKKYFTKNKEDGMVFKGCQCKTCFKASEKESNEQSSPRSTDKA